MIMALLISYGVFSQDVYQQTSLELDDVMNPKKSYVFRATSSVKLLPGFSYNPESGKNMNVEIDRYSVFPPTDGIYGGANPSDDGVVGALSGVFNVSNNGAAVYSVKIETPVAKGALKPDLSLVYNNQIGNGIMGWSWDLSGLSSIVRTNQTEYHDGMVSDIDFINDRYLMDGQRLMLVKGSAYGENKSEYKTEIDNMDKIVSYSNEKSPESFVVWKRDGTIWEYGGTEDSRVETKNDNKIILKWMLNKIYDRNGNAMIFRYDKDVNQGEAYINSILYTVNEDAGVDAAFKVSFVYDKKHYDSNSGYVCGNKVANDRLLKNILIHNNRTGKIIFDYSMEYYNPGKYGNNDFIYHRLKSIGLKAGEEKINPTRILWNAEDKHYNNKFQSYQLNKSVFSDNVPFVGDFNGDGYSDVLLVPYKVQDAYPDDVQGKVYMNNRDGGFYDTPSMSIDLPKNLEWIYVVDMNGDVCDDIIVYEFNYDAEPEDEDVVKLHFYMSKNGTFVNETTYTYKYNVALVMGKFTAQDDAGVLIVEVYNKYRKKRSLEYVRMHGDELEKIEMSNEGDINDQEADYLGLDVTGDGVTELMTLYDDGYKVFKMKWDDNCAFEKYSEGDKMSMNSYIFPNDFNGDGKTDILYYETSRQWGIVFSKGTAFSEPVSCNSSTLLRNVTLNSKDRYKYSLRELQEPSVTIRTGDFDGDGVADIGVLKNEAGNHYMMMGFKPYVKPDNTCVFAKERRYYMPINYSHQTLHVGRFLSQENVSILSGLPRNPLSSQKACIVSLYPQTAFYSVERIVDGMGNVRGFSYGYLMQKNNEQEKFYTCTNDITANDIRRMPIPVSALKTDTVYSVNGNPIVTKYEYYNALIHSKGHGFMGFEKMTTRMYLYGNLFEKNELVYDIETFKDYGIVMPAFERKYKGEGLMLIDKSILFDKYSCKLNDKVVLPVQMRSYEVISNPDKLGDIMKLNIVDYGYASDIAANGNYEYVVGCTSVVKGFTDKVDTYDAASCRYIDNVVFAYKNDVDNWIINRPSVIYKYKQGPQNEMSGSVKYLVYDDKVPNRIIEETNVPNCDGDFADSLLTVIEYDYDKVGNIIWQSFSSPSVEHKKIVRSEYAESYGYLYKTKSIDELGREIRCDYDMDYGYVTSTMDYNGFVTLNEKDPFAIDDVITLPDGMKKTNVIRWAKSNEHSPSDASYYTWEKSTGMSEKMVFYHKSGAELRQVSFDVNGKAIYVDKEYDDYGNLILESLPYYKGDDKCYVSNVYDNYNRMVSKKFPNGLICDVSYDGDMVISEYISTSGDRRVKRDTYNFMGWMVASEDVGGNEIRYEYYCDGLVKSAAIAKNPNSKITVTYDNLRNKKTLEDPNYGMISYQYDALGNVVKVTNPKGNVVEFKYDVLGRVIYKNESSPTLEHAVSTQWIYDEAKGKNGMLWKVIGENHNVEYMYDSYLRLSSVKETIKGDVYTTLYKYDPANRISKVTYPSGLCLSKVYSNTGYEKEIYDENTLLWKTNKTIADGTVIDYLLGNGVVTNILYDPAACLIKNIYTHDEKKNVQNLEYEYDDWGNMLSRCQLVGAGLCEEFEYDGFDRLVSVKLNGKNISRMNYDYQGNIVEKKEGNVKVLYSTLYDKSKPNAIIQAKTDDSKMFMGFSRDVKFSGFDNLISVKQGDDMMEIEYGNDNGRIYVNSLVDGKNKSKIYVGDCEFVEEDGHCTMVTYIKGPIGVFAVCAIDEKGNKTISYIHKDNLGSWNVITDEKAEIIQNVAFDAWGNVRNGIDWSLSNKPELICDRGFTGHEHLIAFGMINMNGRIYDPMMSMMVSPDNNIQFPKMSQNFNRYSYCLNNPLKYTDPTGEWVESVVMGIVGGAANLVMNAKNVDTFGEGALVFGVGFVKGFLTEYTAGQSWFVQVGVQTLMAGVTSGVNQMVAVGDGSFKFSGDDWNSIKTAAHYSLGNALVKNIMFIYMIQPTEDQYAVSLFEMCYHKELAYSVTSSVAHGVGCWFSGRPLLPSMRFKDVGFDLKMLGVIAKRMLVSYLSDSKFADQAIRQRAQEIKESMLEEIRAEDPDYPYFYYTYEVRGICVDEMRLYIIGDVFEMLPGEMFELYPKPYMEEIVSYPFSYSLFKTLFFNDNE